MNNLSAIIKELQTTQGAKAKQAVLERERDAHNTLLMSYLHACYEPRFNYYMTAAKMHEWREKEGMQPEQESTRLWSTGLLDQIIDNLAGRRLTGHAAKKWAAHIYCCLSAEDRDLVNYLLDGDIRATVSGTMINKVWPNLLTFSAYQRCLLPKDVDMTKWFEEDENYVQLKADGTFTNISIHADRSENRVFSRQGKPYPLQPFYNILDALQDGDGFTFHGELLVLDGTEAVLPREIGNGMINAMAQGEELPDDHRLQYLVWDAVPTPCMQKRGKYEVTYGSRLEQLRKMILDSKCVKVIDTWVANTMEEVLAIYRRLLAQGQEGVIFKRGLGTWKDGDSKDQIKFKLEVDVDLVCVGFREATKGKHMATFASMLFRTSDDKLEVGVSGFKDSERAAINANRAFYIGSISTIRANNWSAPTEQTDGLYSLYLPRHIERRTDKNVADTLQQVIDQFDAAVK